MTQAKPATFYFLHIDNRERVITYMLYFTAHNIIHVYDIKWDRLRASSIKQK
jgi:hypothetical protein